MGFVYYCWDSGVGCHTLDTGDFLFCLEGGERPVKQTIWIGSVGIEFPDDPKFGKALMEGKLKFVFRKIAKKALELELEQVKKKYEPWLKTKKVN